MMVTVGLVVGKIEYREAEKGWSLVLSELSKAAQLRSRIVSYHGQVHHHFHYKTRNFFWFLSSSRLGSRSRNYSGTHFSLQRSKVSNDVVPRVKILLLLTTMWYSVV